VSRLARVVIGGVPAVAVLWAVLIAAAPWSDAAPAAVPIVRLTAAATYMTGSLVCHQLPGRSFHSHGAQWPVCGRCAGLYLSAAAGVLLMWAVGGARRRLPFSAWRDPLVLAAIPTAVTLVLERLNPAWSSTFVRALAAAPLGAAIGALLAAFMSFQGRLEGCERTPSSG
jgi:uncharacterized membrane protein